MHLFEAWTRLGPFDLARLLGIPLALLVATLLPGRRPARVVAFAIALAVAALGELSVPLLVRAGWVLLWLVVAWRAGRADDAEPAEPAAFRRAGGFEAGVLAVPLGVALALLLLAAVSRQTLDEAAARRASLAVFTLVAGLLHLMVRRHIGRASLAFAGLGLGLELFAGAGRAADVAAEGAPAGVALMATAFALALAWRIAVGRTNVAGSPFVSDAHELHD